MNTKLSIVSGVIATAIASAFFLGAGTALAVSPSPVDLLSAGNFTILAETAITTTGVTSIVGDVGISAGAASDMTGFGQVLDGSGTFSTSALVTGKIYASDYTPPTPATLTTAVTDMMTAYTDAAGRAPDVTELGAGNIGGMTLVPGVYKWSTGVTIPTSVTLSGGPSDVWIFEIEGDLTIASAGDLASGIKVVLAGGAQAANVFWQVAGPTGAVLGTFSTFNGTILSAKQIIMQNGAVLNGRALAQTQVTLIGNTISGSTACPAVTQTLVSDTANNTVATGGSPAVSVTPHAAWTATIPGSTTWIWETGPTSVDEVVAFERSFTVSGTVLSAVLDIAADNSYKVFIDGVEVAADPAENNFQLATQDTHNLTASTTPGTHTLRIEVKNNGTFNASSNPAGLLYKFTIITCPTPPPSDVTVTIVKYVDGQHANTTSAEGQSFPMQSSWNATNIGAGSGTFSLGPVGFNNPNPYEATTSNMSSGADYSTNEVTSGPSVGASCADGKPFALVGYTTGNNEAAAVAASLSTTSPAFTGLTSNKYVIVWNKDCTPKLTVTKIVINDNGGVATTSDFALFIDNATTTSGVATTTTVGAHVVSENNLPGYTATIGGDCDVNGNVTLAAGESKNCTITNDDVPPLLKVHILKYLDGAKALASTTSGYLFPMESTWNTANLNAGATTTGNYVLGNNHGGAPDLYGADTSPMQAPVNYSTHELTGGVGQPLSPGATCQTGAYRLVGYSTSATSFVGAASSTISTTTPSFFGLNADQYVIVWNETCVPPPPPPSPIAACNSQTPPLGFTLLNGSTGHDNVTLAPNTMFVGHGGNDKVNGGNGNYIICLGNGHDKVTLGNGNADIDAGDGNNKINVGSGNGSIYAGVDNDKITTGSGNHTINAGEGNNTIDTGDGTQNVTTGSGADKITTGNGGDTIAAGEGNNKVKAGGGADTITTGAGNDTVDGGAGIDSCNAGGGINNVINCP